MKQWYDKKLDILNLEFEVGASWKSIELPEGIVFDITKEGKITGIELFKASKLFKGNKKVLLN